MSALAAAPESNDSKRRRRSKNERRGANEKCLDISHSFLAASSSTPRRRSGDDDNAIVERSARMMRLVLSLLLPWVSLAFVAPQTTFRRRSTVSFMARVSFESLSDVGYTTKVEKPLGVVFSDNEDPYFGLVVDELEPDMNGSKAGLKIGDQLVAVNGESVVGETFEYTMDFLKNSPSSLELQLYRGTVRQLYTIIENMNAFEDDADEEEEVVMDENYETTVFVEVEDEKPLSAGDVFNALKNIGNKLTEKDDDAYVPKKEEKKENKGLFGGLFSGETIQLEGDDAKGLKRQPKNRS